MLSASSCFFLPRVLQVLFFQIQRVNLRRHANIDLRKHIFELQRMCFRCLPKKPQKCCGCAAFAVSLSPVSQSKPCSMQRHRPLPYFASRGP